MASEARVEPGQLQVTKKARTVYSVLIFLGALTFIFGLMANPDRIWQSYLTSYFYFASLALGGLFFTAIQFASNAGWSVTIRRIPESFVSLLPWMAVGAFVLFFGSDTLYTWLNPEIVAADPIIQKKTPYLNESFFAIRLIIYFVGWLAFGHWIVNNSLKQDVSGDEKLTVKNTRLSVVFIMFFALSYSLFSVDLMMSLHPHWFSTIFGVYTFAGLFQSTIAFMVIMLVWLKKQGLLKKVVNENHFHDLGKFLFAFTVFYAYIAFSQFMLIWYANLPEETSFYLHRSHGGWMGLSLSLLFFKFILPFFALLPRWAKRNTTHLVIVSVLILFMQYVELYWLVYPNFNDNHIVFSWWEIGMFLGFLGLFLMGSLRFLAKHNLVPVKDPRLDEAVEHHVTY